MLAISQLMIAVMMVLLGAGGVRYAVTRDILVTEFTYLQFYIAMGCFYTGRCYGEFLNNCSEQVTTTYTLLLPGIKLCFTLLRNTLDSCKEN